MPSHAALTIKTSTSILATLCLVSACETSDELIRGYPGESTDISGVWLSNCHEVSDFQSLGAQYLIEEYHINLDTSFKLFKDFYQSENCNDDTSVSFSYTGHYQERAKVLSDDGSLAIHIFMQSRNPNWPAAIADVQQNVVVSLQEDTLYFGHYENNDAPTINYNTIYTLQ